MPRLVATGTLLWEYVAENKVEEVDKGEYNGWEREGYTEENGMVQNDRWSIEVLLDRK